MRKIHKIIISLFLFGIIYYQYNKYIELEKQYAELLQESKIHMIEKEELIQQIKNNIKINKDLDKNKKK